MKNFILWLVGGLQWFFEEFTPPGSPETVFERFHNDLPEWMRANTTWELLSDGRGGFIIAGSGSIADDGAAASPMPIWNDRQALLSLLWVASMETWSAQWATDGTMAVWFTPVTGRWTAPILNSYVLRNSK